MHEENYNNKDMNSHLRRFRFIRWQCNFGLGNWKFKEQAFVSCHANPSSLVDEIATEIKDLDWDDNEPLMLDLCTDFKNFVLMTT